MSYDSWLEKPYRDADHDCPNPDDCTCEEDAADAYEDALIERGEREREDRYLDGPDGSWEP